MKLYAIILVSLLVFLAGCVKEKPIQTQFKNDVITIENFIVDDVAPYSDTTTSIKFDVKNNGDRPISFILVDFFDLSGLKVTGLKCQLINKGIDVNYFTRQGLLSGEQVDEKPKCSFNNIEPLDTRSVTVTLKAPKIISPTPYTVSFSVNYIHKGTREALIPIIDGVTKKEPSFQFSQSETTLGPIFFDILPQLEREKIIDSKTIKVYWGINDQSFLTKFVMKDRSTIDAKVKQTNINKGDVQIETSQSLKQEGVCDFDSAGGSNKPVNSTFNTLICNFKPEGVGSEYTTTIKVDFDYSYEFIKSQNFVVQPRIGGD